MGEMLDRTSIIIRSRLGFGKKTSSVPPPLSQLQKDLNTVSGVFQAGALSQYEMDEAKQKIESQMISHPTIDITELSKLSEKELRGLLDRGKTQYAFSGDILGNIQAALDLARDSKKQIGDNGFSRRDFVKIGLGVGGVGLLALAVCDSPVSIRIEKIPTIQPTLPPEPSKGIVTQVPVQPTSTMALPSPTVKIISKPSPTEVRVTPTVAVTFPLTPKMEAAKAIFKEDFFGPDQVYPAVGVKINPNRIPDIQIDLSELEKAREAGQFLIFRPEYTDDGKPLTMDNLDKIFTDHTKTKGLFPQPGLLLSHRDQNLRTDTPMVTWALTAKELLAGSAGVDYLAQTKILADYVSNAGLFEGNQKYVKDSVEEFNKLKDPLSKLKGQERMVLNEHVVNLKLNQFFRQTVVEAFFDMLMFSRIKNQRLLEKQNAWTNRPYDLSIMMIGSFVKEKQEGYAIMGFAEPDYTLNNLGTLFSRRVGAK